VISNGLKERELSTESEKWVLCWGDAQFYELVGAGMFGNRWNFGNTHFGEPEAAGPVGI